jgi:hypothetical protein
MRIRAWWVLPLALLTLPGCADIIGLEPWHDPSNLDRGPQPWSGAVFCDIEKPAGRRCATDAEMSDPDIMHLSAGAEALVVNQKSNVALDFSADAQAACGTNKAQLVEFENDFPDGTPICVNCLVVAATASDANGLCIAQCEDLTGEGEPADPALTADCTKRAHLSINATTPTFCFEGACSAVGDFDDTWLSPRRDPEPVTWQNVIAVNANNNTLTKDATGTNAFDAGAASKETITTGDAYVEFTATGISTRIVGLSLGDTDTDSGFVSIDYGLDLFKDGCVYIFEKGAPVSGPLKLGDPGNPCTVDGAFLTYADGDKFRISVTDNNDGTATIGYVQVTAACATSLDCPSFADSSTHAPYSQQLRVDTSFHDDNAVVENVVIVRIRK